MVLRCWSSRERFDWPNLRVLYHERSAWHAVRQDGLERQTGPDDVLSSGPVVHAVRY